ncbi:hypothetical protein OS493_023720 [Desmophyllum pertusum]|uniref:ShKT domain-containing protein n=1 Tax=Desmophyllum pertusum TaxID=174260 RepID=A0A9W9YZQ9_9CNID|nr:hypothetical protein OS493_023720 [Desmophyllum pertusum]
MMPNTFLVAALASLMLVTYSLPFHKTVLSQDMAKTESSRGDSETSGCPDPRDLHYCMFEALYNDACFENPVEMTSICNNFCSGFC